MSSFSFQYSSWFLVLCAVLAAAYTMVLYYRDSTFSEKEVSNVWWKRTMSAARFVLIFFLCMLLLSPFFSHRSTQTFKPIVAIVADNSESMKYGLGKDTAVFKQTLKELGSALGQNYEVVQYTTGDALRSNASIDFSEKSSNLSSALDELNGIYYNRNLGAVILATDGIYNKGINPVYSAENSTYQVYSIAVGDTSIKKDQRISAVLHNKLVYLNDKFALRADIESNNLNGKSTKVTGYEITDAGPKSIDTKEITYNNDAAFRSVDFVIPANKTGVAHYRIALENIAGEVTYQNNVRDIYVEVLDGRQKVLLVANTPHPDVAAFKSAIESNKNYQLDVALAEGFNKPLNEYNLIILHQLPSGNQKITNLLQAAQAQKKSLLFVLGTQSFPVDFSKAQNLVSVRGSTNNFNDVSAQISKDFALFTLSEKTLQTLPKLPPLSNFFGDYTANPSAKTLLNQKINNVTTDYPLWVFGESGETKTGVVCAEGLWRWRNYDYMLNKSHDATNELINKTVQYLSVKNDKRPFRVTLNKNIFQDNEAVIFDAQVYNSNYELINTPDVELEILDENGDRTKYSFSKTDNSYTLNAGFFAAGNYSYTATTSIGNNTLTASGKFSVSPLQLEEIRTRADHQWLYKIAAQHNGSMHYLSTAKQIAEEINNKNQLKPVLYDTFLTESAINLKWIFVALLALLSLEWGTRKYLGGY